MMDTRPRIVQLDALPASPWKNGGGVTRELASAPRAAGPGFAWRVSVADIERPGPFSSFDGYRRRLVLLDGTGLYLASPGQPTARLNLAGDQHAFDGGDAIKAALCAGACRVVNIMIAHDVRCAWTVRLLRDASVAVHGAFILLPAQGPWRADDEPDVSPGTALIRMDHRAMSTPGGCSGIRAGFKDSTDAGADAGPDAYAGADAHAGARADADDAGPRHALLPDICLTGSGLAILLQCHS